MFRSGKGALFPVRIRYPAKQRHVKAGGQFPTSALVRTYVGLQCSFFISDATVLPVYFALVDSSIVNREIKSVIRPLLQDAGLTQFTMRTGWRYAGEKIDVVNFQSFNSYLANSVGCTTYSFCVRLGCSFDAIPRNERVKRKDEFLLPEEYECHFRRRLQKTIRQPNLKRKDIWYVDPSGENLKVVIEDARKAILENGLPWFNRFTDLTEVLRTLQQDSESNEGTSGFGTKTSPSRHFMTGYVALSRGKTQLASDHILKALLSGCFKDLEPKMRMILEQINKG
jgi:hypothetical protein